MRTLAITMALFTLFGYQSQSQNNTLNGVYLGKPVPYRFVREADMMWSKTVWRMVDLREKINLPLYYPTIKMDDRYSLIDLLLFGVRKEGLTVYNPDETEEFSTPMTWKDIEDKFGVRNDTFPVENPETGLTEYKIIKTEMTTSEVTKIMIKELWYFDKQTSQLEVRILGICPIREYVKSDFSEADDEDDPEIVMKKVFWVDFPSVRFLLASHFVFNPFNDAERMSFDNLFFKRRFSSYVYKESNVYDNRSINEYKYGLDVLLESNKIQDEIFVMEHDLWEH